MTTDDFESLTFRPSVVRVAALGMFFGLAVALVLWAVLALVFDGTRTMSQISALFLILGPVVTAPGFAKRGVIEIAHGMISGPAPFGGREMIQLEDVDWRRTENRTFVQRVSGVQRIYSTSGRQIVMTPWWYRPEDVWKLSEALRVRYSGLAS